MRNSRKQVVIALILVAAGNAFLAAQTQIRDPGVIVTHHAAADFIAGNVSKGDLDAVIAAGVRAPSAMNRQPWHFTVVTTAAVAGQIIPGTPEGNVLIVISATGGNADASRTLDCALAAESMYLAAQALGLGSRIYTGPVDAINKRHKTLLGIPKGDTAIAVVRVGKVQSPDVVSGASPRRDTDSTVTYR